jgi:hypothetical protein
MLLRELGLQRRGLNRGLTICVGTLLLPAAGTENADPSRRLESISWHLKDRGCENFELIERAITSPASVLVGESTPETGSPAGSSPGRPR